MPCYLTQCLLYTLSQDDAGRRRRSLASTSFDDDVTNKGRRIQEGDQCYCATVNAQEGAPTEREFIERFDQELASLSSLLGSNYSITSVLEDTAGFDRGNGMACTADSQCVAANEGNVCVQNTCLHDGMPRFTLTWSGDDDLDLAVYTPRRTAVWYNHPFDGATNGAFDTDYVQSISGNHVESIYFPNGPAGVYRMEVVSYEQRGGVDDDWTLQVYEGGTMTMQITGSGSTVPLDENLLYTFGG